MAVAMTDTVINYSGLLHTKTNNSTRLLNAVYARGRTQGEGIIGTGVKRVNSIEFALSSDYSIPAGTQPAISENASLTAPTETVITRDQKKNCIQIFHKSVGVSYLKQSAYGTLGGINIAGQQSNVQNEVDFQVAGVMEAIKKELDYTLINGAYQEGTNNTTAWKSRGIIAGLNDSKSEYTALSADFFSQAINDAFGRGFVFEDGALEMWVNPADLQKINSIYGDQNGFGLPASRTEGGFAIKTIMTDFGMLDIDYDQYIPQGTMLILNMRELAIAELFVPGKDGTEGSFFYEELARTGAAFKGQVYGQAGIDYGAAQKHILLTKSSGGGG
mgnify:FL=1